jgi:predicted dehydrogenase
MTEAAAAAGKHIVCTKPLTAYVGQDLPANASDEEIAHVDRRHMLAVATTDAQAMVEAAQKAGVQLMYGENWVYAPSITRAVGLIMASQGTIVEMRGGECHSGSHSPYSKIWRYTGGGALLRLGSHPIGGMLYLKQQEGLARNGQPIRPVAVSAEVGDLSRIDSVAAEAKPWVVTGWQDVENWAAVIITFADGARAVMYASDAVLGGMESKLEIFLSNSHLKCNLSPNNLLQAYSPHPDVLGNEYIMEKASTSAGWSTPIPDEDWSSGHLAMCQDFITAVAENRPARADGILGLEVIRLIYTAYIAATTGQRIEINSI